MKKMRPWAFVPVLIGFSLSSAELEIEDIHTRAYAEVGQIVSGTQGGNQPLDKDYVHRLGAFIFANPTAGDRLSFNLEVGGVGWQPFPVVRNQFYRNNVRTSFVIRQAWADFKANDAHALNFGFLRYKYNDYTTNLGEYLFRSEAYPSIVRTDGWTMVDDAAAYMPGVVWEWDLWDGLVEQDFMIVMDWQHVPVGDFSPAYLFTVNPMRGIQIGGGVSFHRWLSVPQNDLAPKTPQNTYMVIQDFPEVQNIATVAYRDSEGLLDTAFVAWRGGQGLSPEMIGSAASIEGVVEWHQTGAPAGERASMLDHLLLLKNCSDGARRLNQCRSAYLTDTGTVAVLDSAGVVVPNTYEPLRSSQIKHLTFKSIKVMGRFALDLEKMLDLESGPFAFFGEAAVLGTENQPFYYTDISQRIPIMLGVHIPTFGLLDLFSVEVEKFTTPYLQSESAVEVYIAPTPTISRAPGSFDYPTPAETRDDLKWSVLLEKTLVPGLALKVKFASDYLRLRNDDFEQLLNMETLMTKPSEWYYVAQLHWKF